MAIHQICTKFNVADLKPNQHLIIEINRAKMGFDSAEKCWEETNGYIT